MIEERMAFGVYLKSGVIRSKVRNTTADMTRLETGDREKEPEEETHKFSELNTSQNKSYTSL